MQDQEERYTPKPLSEATYKLNATYLTYCTKATPVSGKAREFTSELTIEFTNELRQYVLFSSPTKFSKDSRQVLQTLLSGSLLALARTLEHDTCDIIPNRTLVNMSILSPLASCIQKNNNISGIGSGTLYPK